MGAKVGPSGGGGMDEINVTPLIDIVLVLLIIFMVLTPITVEKMASNLPPTDPPEEPPPDQVPPDQLMVAIYDDNTVALNLKPEATDEALHEDVRVRLRGKEKKTVFVDAHPNANYGRVITVIDLVRDAGADKIGFAELKDEGPARLPPGMDYATFSAPAAPAAPAPGSPPTAP